MTGRTSDTNTFWRGTGLQSQKRTGVSWFGHNLFEIVTSIGKRQTISFSLNLRAIYPSSTSITYNLFQI